MSRLALCLMLAALLAGCGLKRNLELPGHEKRVSKSQQSDQTNQSGQAAPATTATPTPNSTVTPASTQPVSK